MITSLGTDLVRLLLPNACVVCRRAGSPDHDDGTQLLCGLCRSRLVPLAGGCARCGQPLPPVGPCRFCATWDGLAHARSAVWLEEGARQAVHALKYRGTVAIASVLADVVAQRIARPAGVLVPVPLGARRLRHRGFNQAETLARALGRAWRLPVAAAVLRRRRETTTQTALAPDERRRNVADAFVAREAPKGKAGTAVILVDDVLTTGATLLAAAAALHAAGWPRVEAVTFARAEPWGRRIAG